jgi:hypothetical protein
MEARTWAYSGVPAVEQEAGEKHRPHEEPKPTLSGNKM